MSRPLVLGFALASFVLHPAPGAADHQALHGRPPSPAYDFFPPDFGPVHDAEWDPVWQSERDEHFPVGGFGGIDRNGQIIDDPGSHAPVVFVHGNNVDHADWYPVQDAFRDAGWPDAAIWGLSLNGMGNQSGSAARTENPRRDEEHLRAFEEGRGDYLPRITSNEVNVPDLCWFLLEVRRWSGSTRFSIVAHSLGVTVARRTLEVCTEEGVSATSDDPGADYLRDDLVAFVAIAGGNHGTSLCPPGSALVLPGCDELEKDSPWLAGLNAAPEEFGTAAVMTVYDGTGAADIGYLTPAYAHSPRLGDVVPGAVDCAYGRGHNDLRLDAAIVAAYRAFLEAAGLGSIPDDPCGPGGIAASDS